MAYQFDTTKVRKIYDTLAANDYEQDYETFQKGFYGNENTRNRQKVYDLLKENGYDVGATYNEFMQRLEAPAATASIGKVARNLAAIGQSMISKTVEAANQGAKALKPQPSDSYMSFKMRRGGKDILVSAAEAKAAGGIQAWAAQRPGAPWRVYMSGGGFDGHVPLPEAHNRWKQKGYQYTLVDTRKKPAPAKPDRPLSPVEQAHGMLEIEQQIAGGNKDLGNIREQTVERMQNMRKSTTRPLGESELVVNPGTGKRERNYFTEQGNKTNSKLEQSYENTAYNQWWENNTEQGRKSKEERLNRELFQELDGQYVHYDNAALAAWEAAEKRLKADRERIADDVYGSKGNAMDNAALLGGPQNRIMNASENNNRSMVARFTHFDLDRLMSDAWDGIDPGTKNKIVNGIEKKLSPYFVGKKREDLHAEALKMAQQQSKLRVYQLAVEKNAPKDALDYLMRKIGDMNLLTSLNRGMAVMNAGGKTGDMAAYEAANEIYRQDGHKILDVTGMVAGFALDPTTWLSAGVGSAATRGAMWAGGRWLAGRGASAAVTQAATRQFATSMTGRIVGGIAGGAANFGTFEGVKEMENQFAHGGHIVGQDETGRYINEGYSAGAVAGQFGHGLMMGAAVGWLGPVSGNVSDKLVRATSSTVGKVATRAGVYTGATLAEGTIFSVPEWIEGERDAMDVWNDNMAMMVGFKAKHMLKSAGGVLGDLKASFDSPTNGQKNRLDFESRLRQRMDAPSDGGMGLTEDEKAELKRYGYDLRDLVESSERTGDAAEGSLIAQNAPEIVSRLTDMVTDPRISEAARAKMYYFATGRRLPMSTVMRGELIEDGDGGFIVESQGANGVITSRSFKSRKAADLELERIKRQTELNSIEIGERYQQTADFENRLQEACRTVAAENGWDMVEVYRTCEEARRNHLRGGDKQFDEAQQNILHKVTEAMGEFEETGATDAMRGRINEKYGVDIDGAIRKEANRRTQQEQTAIDEYIAELIPDKAKEPNPVEDAQAEDITNQKLLSDEPAEPQGPAEGEPIDPRFDNSTPAPDYDPHQPNGDLWPTGRAVMKFQDRPVEVLSGRVVMMEDGTMVDKERSDASIVIRDLATGEIEMVSPDAILSYEAYPETLSVEEVEAMQGQGAEAPQPEVEPQSKYTSGQIKIRNSDGTETRGVLTGYVDENGNHEYYVEGDLQHLHYASEQELNNILSEYQPDEPLQPTAEQPQAADRVYPEGVTDTEAYDNGLEDGAASTSMSDEELNRNIERFNDESEVSMLTDYGRGWVEGLKQEQQRRIQAAQPEQTEQPEQVAPIEPTPAPTSTPATTPTSTPAEAPQGEVTMPTGVNPVGTIAVPQRDGSTRTFTVGKDAEGNNIVVDDRGFMWAHDGNGNAMQPYSPGANVPVWTDEQLSKLGAVQPSNEQTATVPNQPENVPTSTETHEIPTENAVSPAESVPNPAAPVENVQETPAPTAEPTPLQRIPRDAKGEPIFEQAENPEHGWDALVEFAEGDAATAKEIADTMAEEKRKAYEKAQKQKPKGKTPTEILASKKAISAGLAQAEQEYNLWQQMANVEQRRQDAIRAQQEAEARQRAAERAEAEKAERAAREEAERIEREALEGIPEWHLDTPENARKRGARRFSGQMFTRQEPIQGVAGKEVEVKFSQKDLPKGRVAVIEAPQLQPSHIQGQRNPMFFIEEAQPKNRAESVSRFAAMEMAEGIRPQEITGSATAYTGAPTVNTRGEVIQGNNRSDALRFLWDNHLPEQQQIYKQYLLDNAEQFGLDPEAVNAMERPVLVNMLDVDDAEAIRLGQMTAQDTESGGIERIKPKNVAHKLGEDLRTFANQLLRSGDDEATFGQLVDRNGTEVLKWMAQKGAITSTQYQSAFDSKGNLTAEAKNDLQKVLYQAIFKGGSQQLEEMFNKLPSKAQRAILATAFRDMDSPFAGKMLPEIQASIAAFNQLMSDTTFATAKKMEDVLKAVEAWKQQYALDDRFEQYSPADNFSNFALHLAAMYNASDVSQTTLAGYFNQMYDLAQGKKAATLFEEADTTEYPLAEVIQQVLGIEYKPAKNGINNVANGGADVALRNQDGQGGELRGNEPPASGEQNPTGTEPSDRGAGASDDSRGVGIDKRGGESEAEAPQTKLSKEDATDIIAKMEMSAVNDPQISLSPESWQNSFGLSNSIDTPLGKVKMGEGQYQKLVDKKRSAEFGMVVQTLQDPDVVFIEPSEAKEGQTTERDFSYVFVKTFIRNGQKFKYYTSVSVLKDGMEVSVSSHIASKTAIMKKLQGMERAYTKQSLLPNSSEWHLAEHPTDVPDLLPTQGKSDANVETSAKTEPQQPNNAVSSDSSLSTDEQSGTSSIEPNGESTVSDRKVNNSATEKQGSDQESSVQPSDNKGKQGIQTTVEAASAQVNTEPTPAQAKAGNYKKGHVTIGDFDITIENPAGSVRKGVDADGKEWSNTMANTYGYIKGTEGVDGDHIDVFLHSDMDQWNGRKVYVVDQTNTDGSFDEHKVMLGFNDKYEAMSAYLANYDKTWSDTHPGLRISGTNITDFDKWVQSSHRKTKSFADYTTVSKVVDEAPVKTEPQQHEQPTANIGEGYKIESKPYTNKRGKTLDTYLVTFDRDFSKEELSALRAKAKALKGWYDRESKGFMLRGSDDAKAFAEDISAKSEDEVADDAPLSMADMGKSEERRAESGEDIKTKGNAVKKVDVAGMIDALNTKGETKPSDHAKPVDAPKPKKRRWISDEDADEFDSLRKDLRSHFGKDGDIVQEAGAEYGKPKPKQMDAEVLRMGTRITYLMMKGGLRSFSDYCEAMKDELPDIFDDMRPHLKSLYAAAQNMEEVIELGWDEEMDDRKTVKAFDVYNFDKPGAKDIIATAQHSVDENASQQQTDQIIQTLKDQRNEQRKKEADETSADTETIIDKAETTASQVESKLEAANSEEDAERLSRSLDKELEEVNKQLALLGYYEADPVDKDFNEAYGYMRNAERKAVQDAHRLATQLAADLGITIDPKDKVRKAKYGFGSKIARSNVAPAGGEVYITLPLAEDHELKVNIYLEPSSESGKRTWTGDNLMVTRILYTIEGGKRSRNCWAEPNTTYDELLADIRREVRTYLPEEHVKPAAPLSPEPGEDYVDMAKRVSAAKESKSPGVKPQQTMTSLFGDELGYFDSQGNPIDGNGKYVVEEVESISEISDDDFMKPTRNVVLPELSRRVSDAIGAEGRRPMIKKNIFGKNRDSHKDLTAEDGRRILNEVLYNPNLYGQNQKVSRPYNWIMVHLADKNSAVVLEVNPTKEYLEIVNWHYIGGEALARKKRQAVKEGGRILTLQVSNAAAYTHDELSYDGKGNNKTSNNKRDEKIDVRARTEGTERGGQQPRPNEPLGEGAKHEDERTDGGRMAQRGGEHSAPDTGRGAGVSGQHQSERGVTAPKNTRNNHAERGVDYAPKGEKARIDANIAALGLAKKLLESGRAATPQEMSILRRYSGWGGLGAAFNEGSAWAPNPVNKRLREALTPEEYQAAVMSRNSAYYTPAAVIDAMWDVAKALGFKGGNIVEGSAGIGNIIGLMPTDISERSNIHAVEIDPTTGGILSLLYPDAKVEVQGFEKTRIANGSVDLAITNVPFVKDLHVMDESGDSDLSKKFRDIHDFCIAKNVRKLREGGIGIFITSSGTLDKSQKLRNWLVGDKEGNADVVGVFRMNNQTFGGTAATSDIIVVRKRVNGRRSANAIDVSTVTPARTATFTDARGKTKDLPLYVNRYFIEHPEHMGGEMFFGFEQGDTYRPTSIGLFPTRTADQSARMAAWVQHLADMDWSKEQGKAVAEQTSHINEALGEGVKEGSMVTDSEGNLCVARMGRAVPLSLNKNKIKGRTKEECFKDYTEIKSALADVLKYQTEHDDDASLQPLLDRLNRAYDTFVQRYGNLNKNNNLAWLRNDVDFSSIVALETYSEKGNKDGTKVKTYGKTDIFSRRVVEKESEPAPKNVKDGIIASIYKYGRIDTEYLATQLGKSQDDVKQEIVESGLGFVNPTTGQMEVSYEYLSGNVREKLRQAREANEAAGGAYDANIKALEAVVPMNIPAHLIEFALGSSWIEPQLYERYVKERTELDVKLTNAGGTWHMSEPWNTDKPKNTEMGVRSEAFGILIPVHKLIEAALTNKTITVSRTVKDSDGGTHTETDPAATTACATKVDEIRQDFKDWAREQMQNDPALSMRMEEKYNEKFNNSVPKTIPDEFVPEHFGRAATTVGGRPFKLRPHQAKAVIRATTQPVLLAHEVGTGKTYTLITTAMEMRRLGTARKPMIVVQNATVGQFVASAKALYPNAKVLTLEDADRNAEGRRAFYAKIKFNDWDMIVVPQSVFERIPDSIERQTQFIQDKIEEKMLVLEQMKEADPDGRSMIVRAAEREISRLEDEMSQLASGEEPTSGKKKKDAKKAAITRQNAEVKARELLDRATDDVEDFNSMGIDAILVDEAHEYKHLGFATAMQRGVKGVDPSPSKKSQGVFLKTQAVLEKTGGKNVVFATGTPISNTAAEIWTFMRYLIPADVMKEYDIYYFDDFVRNFGNIQQMLEFKTNGKYDEVNRFAGYFNLPELVRIWSTVADTVLTREAGGVSDKIPQMEGGKAQDIFLPQTRALRSIMKFVKEELDRYDKMTGKEKKENSHIPLVMYGIAKAAAVDARLVQSDAEDDPKSKTNEAVRQTLRTLEETKDYKGTVAIFADNYQNKASGFNLYEDIRKKLIAAGVPEEQVVVMKSGMTVKKKLEIFDKVNAGEVRVVMGSTFTLGTGVNIQERLHTLIHLDAPNRPMDYTQRNGRILRQGNLHNTWGLPVRVLRFGVEDSLDVTAYQRLKTKGAIADSIMNGKQLLANSMENRSLEEDQDLFGDITAQLSGSEYAMLKNQIEKEVRKLRAAEKNWKADQTYIHNRKRQIAGQNREAEKRIADNQSYLEKVEAATIGDITVGKLSFPSVDAMEDFFTEQNKKKAAMQEQVRTSGYSSRPATSDITISVGGFDFKIHTEITKEMKHQQGDLFATAPAKMTYSCPELGIDAMPVKGNAIKNAVLDIIENVVSGKDFRERIANAENYLERNNAELEAISKRDGQPFKDAEALEKAEEKLAEYEELMKAEMAAKEAKYAEMDKDVEAAADIELTEEDSEPTASEPAVDYSAENANFASEYATAEGKRVRYTSENPAAYGGLFDYDFSNGTEAVSDADGRGEGEKIHGDNMRARADALQRQEGGGRLYDNGIRGGLDEKAGEFSVVERRFTESGSFNFTSGERIESADDVAYIFSALEDAAKEHSFAVFVKDGTPTVVELGMGTLSSTMVDMPTASLAYSRIKPDEVYFVHNHPSGNLKCSAQDVGMLKLFEKMSDVPVHGVIINLKTGKYGTFDSDGVSGEGMKRIPAEEYPLKVHTLDKQIFAADYDPMSQPLVRSAVDVASFLNSHRMGDRRKVSFLILSRAGRIVGNIHTPFTDIASDTRETARYVSERVIQFGGESAILYGDFDITRDNGDFRALRDEIEDAGGRGVKLLDMVNVEGNHTRSAIDEEVLEPGNEYGGDPLRYREAGTDAPGRADLADTVEAKRERVEQMAHKLGTSVEVVTDAGKLPENMRGRKAWYDTRTGKVVVVLPNHADAGDVAETVFHEVVGHKGLRELVGDRHYDEFCDEIYGHLKDDLRMEVDRETTRRFEREPERGIEHARRVAVDELFGRLAEKGFEDFTKAERGIWAKLKVKVLEAINKFLGSLKLPQWVKLGDNELRYMLWRSHERLRGKGDYVDMAKDAVKREELGLNKSEVIVTRSKKTTADRIEETFDAAVAGDLKGKPVEIGTLTKEGRDYLERLSGTKMKDTVSFVLNPSDLVHIYRRHFGKNETDSRNIPLTKGDIRQIAEIITNPDRVIFGKEKSGNQRNMFFFLKESDNGSYNLMEVYSDRKGNLTAKSFFKSKEGVSQRAMLLNESSTLTSVTDGATLSDGAKLPKFFDIPTIEEGESFSFRGHDGETGDLWGNQNENHLSDDDIRYRTVSTGAARVEYDKRVRTKRKVNPGDKRAEKKTNRAAQLHEAYLDSMRSLRVLQEAVSHETGSEIESHEDAYEFENQMSSRNKSGEEEYRREYIKPMFDAIAEICKGEKGKYGELIDYVLAKHGLERNAFMRTRAVANGEKSDKADATDYSGLTSLTGEHDVAVAEIAAKQMVDKYETSVDTSNLWRVINAATKAMLTTRYTSGLLSRDMYDTIRTQYKNYIPLKGWEETVAADVYEYAGGGYGLGSALVKAYGRNSVADDPFATIVTDGQRTIMEANRNIMKQRFLDLALNHKTDLLTVSKQWFVRQADGTWLPDNPVIPADADADLVDAIVKQHESDMLALKSVGDATQRRSGLQLGLNTVPGEPVQHMVKVKRNGEEFCIYVNGDPRAARAINGMLNPDAGEKTKLTQLAQEVKNFMSKVFTTWNPEFVIGNLSRDLMFAGTAVAIKEDKPYARKYAGNITHILLKASLPRLLYKWGNGTLDDNKDIERYFREFMRNGGETGFTQLNTVDKVKKEMQRFIREAQGGIEHLPKKAWRSFWNGVEFVNRAAEDSTRFGVYMTSRQSGRTISRCISDAKEITVNFNRKGSGAWGARQLNFLYVFFNACMQAISNAGRLVKKHPGKSSAAMASFLASGFLLPMVSVILARLCGDDEDCYWNLPEWVRRNNICLYVPFTHQFLTIPIAHELRPFYAIGELCFSTMMGKETTEDAVVKGVESFSGLMPIDYTGNGGDNVVNFSPTIVQPIVQAERNVDYFGKPIYKKTPWNERDPEWSKSYRGTNGFLVDATRMLSEAGATTDEFGVTSYPEHWYSGDVNPAIIEHLLESYTGGLGKTVNGMGKTISMLWNEDAREIRNVPIARKFLQSSDEKAQEQRFTNEYFKLRTEYEDLHRYYGKLTKNAKGGALEAADNISKWLDSERGQRYVMLRSYMLQIERLENAINQSQDDAITSQLREQADSIKKELVNKTHLKQVP